MPIPYTTEELQRMQALLDKTNLGRANASGQDNTLQGMEGNARINSGIFGDLFRVLRRPAAASAGAALALTGKSPDTSDPFTGAWQGLSGKTDHTYSEVLGALGVNNPIARSVGGFIGDVALDPLTYVGIKGEKGISGVEAAANAVKNVSEENVLKKIAMDTPQFTDAVAAKSAELQAQNPSHMWFTFAGKKVPMTDNALLPKIGNKAKDLLIGPEEQRRLAARMFSSDSEMPFGLADSARVYDGGSAGAFLGHQQAIEDTFKHLDEDQLNQIAIAHNRGEMLQNVPLKSEQMRDGFSSLGDYQKLFKDQMDKFFAEEAAMGIRDPQAYDPNYVYKFFRNPPPEITPGAVGMRARLGNRPDFKHWTLEEAQNAGFDPITNAKDILKLRAASHYRNMGRAAFVQDALDKFGVKATDGNIEYLHQIKKGEMPWTKVASGVDSPLAKYGKNVEDMYLPKPVAEVLNKTVQTFSDASTGSEFMRWYDRIMSNWKLLNTGMSPGYHVRNSFSDAVMNFADGVRNPLHYEQSMKVLKDIHENNLANFMDTGNQIDLSSGAPQLIQNLEKPHSAASTGYVKIGSQNVPTADVWNLYLRSGSKAGQIFADVNKHLSPMENQGLGQFLNKSKEGVAGATQTARDAVSNFSNYREDFFRMSHFLSAMNDELPKVGGNLEQAAMKAGERVRKYNIDYGKLSTFERDYVRRAIPFYTWMRKNIPLQAQMLFTKPGFMALYPKGQDLLQGVLGADDGSGDFLVPKWIRDSAPVRLALGKQGQSNPIQDIIRKLAGAKSGEAVFAPTINTVTPLGELSKIGEPLNAAQDQGIGAGIRNLVGQGVNMITPFAKAPIEAGTQTNLFAATQGQGNAKITDWNSWLLNQVAPTRVGDAVATGDPAKRNRTLASFFAGFGPQAVTDQRQAAELMRRSDVINALNRKAKEDILKKRKIDPASYAGQKLMPKVTNPDISNLQRWQAAVKRHYFGNRALLYEQNNGK